MKGFKAEVEGAGMEGNTMQSCARRIAGLRAGDMFKPRARGGLAAGLTVAIAMMQAPGAMAQVTATPAPNLTTLYGARTTIVRQQYDYTGADVVITAPANAIGVYFKAWGGGGGHEVVVNLSKAGAGGYTGAVFNTTAGTQYTLVVGAGGNRAIRPVPGNPAGSSVGQMGVYGFGGTGSHDQGGGLSGVFTGTATVLQSDRGRALVVAGGGGGSDDDGSNIRTGGTNGNGTRSGYGTVQGATSWVYVSNTNRTPTTLANTMQGSNDGWTAGPTYGTGCANPEWPAIWSSSGGGGYEGGGRTSYTGNFTGVNQGVRCGIDAQSSGRGGSGFTAASNRFSSIEFTPETTVADTTTVNVAPRSATTGAPDTDQTNTTGQPRTVPIGRAGTYAGGAFNTSVNGGGDGRIVVYWVIAAPTVSVQKVTTNSTGGPFAFSATNLSAAVPSITTSSANTATPTTPTAIPVAAPGTAVTLTETAAPGFVQTGAVCNDNNSAVTGNVNPVATATTGAVTIPAAATASKTADIVCTFTNRSVATLRIQKTRRSDAGGPVTFNFTGTGPTNENFAFTMPNSSSLTHDYGTGNPGTVTATPGTTALNNIAAGTYTITESFTDGNNNNFELSNISCVNQAGGVAGSSVSPTYGANGGTASITLVPGANYLCTFVNTRNPNITVTKQVQGGSAPFAYTVTTSPVTAVASPVTFTLTPPANSTAQTNVSVNLNGAASAGVMITETLLPGYVLTSATCTKVTATGVSTTYPLAPAPTNNPAVTIPGFTVDDTASCTFVNTQPATVVIRKQSNGGTRSFDFTGGTNGLPASLTLDTASANPASSSTYTITTPGQPAQITETVPAGWTLTSATCSTAGGPVAATLSGSTLTIPGGATAGGAAITCTFTNTRNTAQVALAKTWVGAAVNDTASLSASGPAPTPSLSSTANTPDETDTGTAVTVNSGTALTLSEAFGVNTGAYNASAWICSGTSGLSGNVLTVGQNDTNIVCTITNTRRRADLMLTKTNTPGVNGDVDDGTDMVTSGSTTTYAITVSNNGPDAANGAFVNDTPTAGLSGCTVLSATASGGAVAPASPGAMLTGGVSIPTFPSGGQVVFQVQCTVD